MFRRRDNAHQERENEYQQQEAKINELKAAIGPLSGRSSIYCSDACYKRYLEARNWNVEKAKKMLKDTIEWRSSYKPEEIRWPEVAHEGETGKIFRASFRDRQGRSVLILRPGMQNTKSFENQIRHLVYLLENAVLNLPEEQEKMSILIDYTGWSITNKVPIKTARETISFLQNHYPERLAVAFFYSPPKIFQAFWMVVNYFLDPRTIEKVKFVYPKNQESVEVMRAFFDDQNLPAAFGGESNLEYDHAEFSKLMLQDDVKTASF